MEIALADLLEQRPYDMEGKVARNPAVDLRYFTEWGGKSWERLLAFAIDEFLGGQLTGRQILEIGTRYGKVSCLFALLGGTSTGIEVKYEYLPIARAEAKKWHIQEKTRFILYDGDLDIFQDETFDVVFTKSVLVVVPELKEFLLKVSAKLRPNGKVVFLENAFGNRILHALRYFKHRGWDYKRATYLTEKKILTIKRIFDIRIVKKSLWPPIYLICGYKRSCNGGQ